MLDAGNFKLRQGVLELIAGIALNNVEGDSGTGIRLEHTEDARKSKHLAKVIKADLADSRLLFNLDFNMDYGRDFQ